MSNFIITHTNHRIDFENPDPSQFDLDDIARALSRLPRFSGHTEKAASVAQHSVGVSRIARCLAPAGLELTAAMEGLMHDAHEAYTGDAPTPFKRSVDNEVMQEMDQSGMEIPECAYHRVQARLDRAIRSRFHLFASEPSYIKFADRIALLIEATGPNVGHDLRTWGLGLFNAEHHATIKRLPEKLIAYITTPRTESRSYADFLGEYHRIEAEKAVQAERLAEVVEVGPLSFKRNGGKAASR